MLYHLSQVKGIDILKASVPETASYYEDRQIKRVCLSSEIDGCLTALQPFRREQFFVYSPIDESLDIYIPKKTQVPDVKFTKEVWSLKDTPVKCIGTIECIETDSEYHTANKQRLCIYRYAWRWIKQF